MILQYEKLKINNNKKKTEKLKSSEKGTGREGGSNDLYPWCVRLLAPLPVFPFLLLGAGTPSKL